MPVRKHSVHAVHCAYIQVSTGKYSVQVGKVAFDLKLLYITLVLFVLYKQFLKAHKNLSVQFKMFKMA